jgi:hypothetical protein
VKSWKNKLYSVVNLKVNIEIVVKLVTRNSGARIVLLTMVEITDTELEQTFACTFKMSCFKLKNKEAQNSQARNFNGNADRRNYEPQDVVFTATSKNEILTDDIWICDSRA